MGMGMGWGFYRWTRDYATLLCKTAELSGQTPDAWNLGCRPIYCHILITTCHTPLYYPPLASSAARCGCVRRSLFDWTPFSRSWFTSDTRLQFLVVLSPFSTCLEDLDRDRPSLSPPCRSSTTDICETTAVQVVQPLPEKSGPHR
jgi:hypothetical protein